MMDKPRMREVLARCLRRDAELQDVEPEKIGFDFELVDREFIRDDRDVNIAIAFWDAWIDERNHLFPGHYEGIGERDWPILAKKISDALADGTAIDDPRVRRHFVFHARPASIGQNSWVAPARCWIGCVQ